MRGRRLFILASILVFCGFILWANAQVEKKSLEPIPTAQLVPEKPDTLKKRLLESMRRGQPIPEREQVLQKKSLESIPRGQPIGERQIESPQSNLQGIPGLQPMAERQPQYSGWDLQSIPSVSASGETLPQYQSFGLNPITSIQGADGIIYQVQEFKDFRGGWNTETYKTKLESNEAVDLENARWSHTGELEKRGGYSLHSAIPEQFNLNYRFYQQDGDKYTIGGSDTALYYYSEHPDTLDWVYLIGTGGTSGRWDATTFNDLLVATHEGIMPVIWDGDTLIEIGLVTDSFKIKAIDTEDDLSESCDRCSTLLSFDPNESGWDNNEWTAYILDFPIQRCADTVCTDKDTLRHKGIIISNTSNEILVRHHNSLCYGGQVIYGYVKIYSWFGVDSVWREGVVDSALDSNCTAHIYDSEFTWDSTFNYDDYIFEVIAGTGKGIKTYMFTWDTCLGVQTPIWHDSAFWISGFSSQCFDSTTTYRIYAPTFTGQGAKFCEVFDGCLWLGWMGTGTEQNKNIVLWSGIDDLGNWPSENHIIIESDDGDYITGMATFPGQYTDVPRHELTVFKNNSFYKIIPSSDGYDFYLIERGVGCVSNATISSAEGKFQIFLDQHGVHIYDQRQVQSIFKKIRSVCDLWDKDGLEQASGVYNPKDGHYYLSVPGLQDTTPSGGDFITSWYMDSAQGAPEGLWTHQIDSAGNELGDDKFENIGTDVYHDIAANESGNYALLWMKAKEAHYDIFLTRYDENGDSVDTSLQLTDGSGQAEAMDISLDMNSLGQMIACWSDDRDGYADIYCQCVDFDTGLVAGNFFLNTDQDTNNYDYGPVNVGINEDGICVAVWQDYRDWDDAAWEIYAQRIQWPDTLLGTNFRVNNCWYWDGSGCIIHCPPGRGPQGQCTKSDTHPVIGMNENKFVVAWHRWTGESGYPVDKRSFLIDGTACANETRVSSGTTSDPASDCDIAMNTSGNYVITWNEATGLDSYQIYARAYDLYDSPQTGVFQVNTGDPDNNNEDVAPAVAINNFDNYVIVWLDGRTVQGCIAYRAYNWSGPMDTVDYILNADTANEGCSEPQIDCYGVPCDTTEKWSLAWSMDFGGWSKESFGASAFCYQHSIFDTVKILFADTEKDSLYYYDTQTDDIGNAVILTYQSPYFSFGQYPSFDYEIRYATIEAFLNNAIVMGNIYLTWYRDYDDSIYYDTLVCEENCREEMLLPEDLWGKNISMKLQTGSDIDDFTLCRFWWEWTVNQKFRK